MPCISPDGKPTKSGLETLKAIKSGASTPEDVATATGQRLFRVRSGLRELVTAGFLNLVKDEYKITSEGEKAIQ